ncbi:MAG: helix-hairpin-helix domain-containing protein [Deltaproteobacteria bacterium]|jgi:competence ComEA-like helix-hairpin-helix protein
MQNRRKMVTVWIIAVVGLIIAAGVYAGDVEKIDINTATAEQLTQLKGIGASHAAAIIAYREKNGPFQKPEDLMQVPRIGRKTLEKNKALIAVGKTEKRLSKKTK